MERVRARVPRPERPRAIVGSTVAWVLTAVGLMARQVAVACVLMAVGLMAPRVAMAEPPTEAAAAETDAPVAEPQAPPPLVVEVVGLEASTLEEELRLRLPDRVVLGAGRPRPAVPIAYAIVRRRADRIELTLIMPGGHAYDHTFPGVEGQSERVAASGLAALLDSIAGGEATPSRTEVEIPEPPPAEPSTPAAEPRPAAPGAPTLELGPFAGPVLGLGLAPRSGASLVLGIGAVLGLDLKPRRGPLVTLELRLLQRAAAGLGLWRLRVAPGVGYRWRRGPFELPLSAHVLVEPWWLRQDGERAPLVRDDQQARRPPLLGAMVRASPGVFVPTSGARLHGVRLGARVELGGGLVPDRGARTVEIGTETSTGREPRLRLGGLELGVGLELGLWFGTPPRRDRAGSPAR